MKKNIITLSVLILCMVAEIILSCVPANADDREFVLVPDANGHYVGLAPVGDTYNYLCVDDGVEYDSDTTYVHFFAGNIDYYYMQDMTEMEGVYLNIPDNVKLYAVAKNVSGYARSLTFGLRINGINYTSTQSITNGAGYMTVYWDIGSNNPDNDEPWTIQDIQDMEYYNVVSGTNLRVTAVWALVHYYQVELDRIIELFTSTALGGAYIELNWEKNWAFPVRIMVSTDGYPSDNMTGELVYEGNDTVFFYPGLAGTAKTMYFSIYADEAETLYSEIGGGELDITLPAGLYVMIFALGLLFISFFLKSVIIYMAVIACMIACLFEPAFKDSWYQAGCVLIMLWAGLASFIKLTKDDGGRG